MERRNTPYAGFSGRSSTHVAEAHHRVAQLYSSAGETSRATGSHQARTGEGMPLRRPFTPSRPPRAASASSTRPRPPTSASAPRHVSSALQRPTTATVGAAPKLGPMQLASAAQQRRYVCVCIRVFPFVSWSLTLSLGAGPRLTRGWLSTVRCRAYSTVSRDSRGMKAA